MMPTQIEPKIAAAVGHSAGLIAAPASGAVASPRAAWLPEKPAWKKLPTEIGMRAAGRLGVILNSVCGSRAGQHVGILMYHRVIPRVPGLPAPLHNVEPKRFARQLEGLYEDGFEFVRLSQLLSAARNGKHLAPRSVVVTFDDGFASVHSLAWPVLKRLSIPATVFVNTAYLDSDEAFPFDAWGMAHQGRAPLDTYRPLRTAECAEMLEQGLVEIGAHTHTHQDFRGSPDAFRDDLALSADIVRKRFGLEEITFAFPYGGVHTGFAGSELVRAAQRAGVACGLTTMAELVDPSDSPFEWGRFNVFNWDTSATLAAKLGGWYGWAPRTMQAARSLLRRMTHLQTSCRRSNGGSASAPI